MGAASDIAMTGMAMECCATAATGNIAAAPPPASAIALTAPAASNLDRVISISLEKPENRGASAPDDQAFRGGRKAGATPAPRSSTAARSVTIAGSRNATPSTRAAFQFEGGTHPMHPCSGVAFRSGASWSGMASCVPLIAGMSMTTPCPGEADASWHAAGATAGNANAARSKARIRRASMPAV